MAMTQEQKDKANKGFAIAGNVLSGVGGILGSIFGGSAVGTAVSSSFAGATDAASSLLGGGGVPVTVGVEDKSRKTLIYLVSGIGAVVLIAAVFGFAGRRRR